MVIGKNTRPSLFAKKSKEARLNAEDGPFDRTLDDLPPDLRWRDFLHRIEVVLFASSAPVSRETLARLVGSDCSIELLVDDLIETLRDRPYTVVTVAGGWQMRRICCKLFVNG